MSDVRFARVPQRVTLALEVGKWTHKHYAVMTYLVAKADHRTKTVTFSSLTALAHAIQWELTPQSLRNVLRQLRAWGEIDFPSKQGMRGAYVIHILPADYFGKPTQLQNDFKNETPFNFEVTSNQRSVHTPATPHEDKDSEAKQLPNAEAPIEVANRQTPLAASAAGGELNRNTTLETLIEELGVTPVTKTERGAWHKAAKELSDVDATPAEIKARCAVYRQRWPSVALTPTALAKHWSSLVETWSELSHEERQSRWLAGLDERRNRWRDEPDEEQGRP